MPKTVVRKIGLAEQGFSGYLAKQTVPSEHGVVVILGGESVGLPFLKLGKLMAERFAAEGFTAVSVSLFGAAGLPDSPDGIPLEYTLNAVRFLRNDEGCKRVSVFGMSMGSLFALGAAVYGEAVDGLVMISPSHAAFEGVSKDRKVMKGRSAMTLNGKDIPYVSADFSKYGMYEAYEKAYADREREAAAMAALPIAKTEARVLLMAGEKDSSWPSAYSVKKLAACLAAAGRTDRCQMVLYPEYGHMLPLKKEVMRKVYAWLWEG